MKEDQQLAALSALDSLFTAHGIDYWLFGGWAVDFHAGAVTRAHDDLDLAVWLTDYERIQPLLEHGGWQHAPEPGEDGYTGYERDGVRLELAFVGRDAWGWPEGSFGGDVAALHGVRVRVVSLESLKADKSEVREDAAVAAKDRADSITLSRIR